MSYPANIYHVIKEDGTPILIVDTTPMKHEFYLTREGCTLVGEYLFSNPYVEIDDFDFSFRLDCYKLPDGSSPVSLIYEAYNNANDEYYENKKTLLAELYKWADQPAFYNLLNEQQKSILEKLKKELINEM